MSFRRPRNIRQQVSQTLSLSLKAHVPINQSYDMPRPATNMPINNVELPAS